MKLYNLSNSLFYILYGLFGAFMPNGMAKVMGWTPDLLGLHQIRAICLAMAALGLAGFITARQSANQAPLVKVFILLTLAFMAGRVLGLVLDGFGPVQSYAEITFEIFWSVIGGLALKRGR